MLRGGCRGDGGHNTWWGGLVGGGRAATNGAAGGAVHGFASGGTGGSSAAWPSRLCAVLDRDGGLRLVGAALAVREEGPSGVILGVVLINAAIGFIQEAKAEQAIQSLKEMLAPLALVVRRRRKT